MAQNQFILSPDQVISNPGENSSGGFKLTPDQVIPFQPLDGAGGYELSEGDIVDRFSTENPETLFYAMKQNPGRPYSEEQIDTFLEYAVERDFDPSRLADEIVEGIVPMIKDFGGSAVDSVIEAIDADKDFVPTGVSAGPGAMPGYFKDDKDESFAVSAAEGLGRGYTELQALAKSIGFANSISLRDINRPTSIKDYGMQPKRKKWSSYTPEEKDSARRKFRSLNRALSDQLRYAEGKGTLIGDVALGLSAIGTKPIEEMTPEELSDAQDRVEEAYITNDYAQSLVNDRVANFASYFSGEFRLGAKLGKNIAGKGAGSELIEGVSGQVSKGAKAAEEVAEGAAESTAPLAKLPVLDDVDKSVGMAREGLRRIADMAAGLKRNIGKQTDENVFLSISRDTFVDPKNRQLAEWIGHGVFTKYPWISPAMRMMAKPTKTVVAGTKRAIGGAIGGGALTAFTMDEEMMAQGVIGSAMVAFGQGSYDQAAWGRQRDLDAAANRWLLNQSPEIQEAIKERGFTNSEIARWSVFERWAQQLITASTGEADINFVYTDGKNFESVYEYLKSEGLADNINLDSVTPYIEKITKNSAADKLVSETRGVQFLNTRNSGGRPIALVNVSAMSPSTIIHEGIHGLGKLDVLQDYFRPISEYIEKKFSADDLDKFYNDYMRRFDQQTEMRVRGFDKSLADNYAQGTPEADPKYWQHARIKDEIMSDIWEAFLMDKDPLYVTRADLNADASKLAKPMGRLGNLLATFMGATGDPKLLSQNYVDRSGKAIDYGDPQLTSAINGLIKFQQRLRFDDDGKVIRGDIGENESGNTIDLSTLTRDNVPKNLMVAKLDENGNYQFDSRGKLVIEKNQKELRKKENLRKNFARTVFQDQSYRPDAGFGNKRPMNYDEETGTISGDYIPEEAMKKFRNAPRWLFPQSQLELLEYINESVRKGEPIILDYNARLVPKGKTGAQYSSAVGSSLRTVIPFGFYITKAGNMLMNTVDLGHLSEKYVRIMRDPKRRGAILKQWGVDGDAQATRAAFDKDLIQYMNNIARPDAELGVLKGLGDEATAKRKANVLSAFFGFKKKDIQFRNNAERQRILLEHLNPDRQDNLIRSRRVDAINDIAQSQLEKMPLSTQGRIDIQQNKYEPGLTRPDQLNTVNPDERPDTGLPSSQFSTDPKTGGLRFHDGLGRTAREHPLGAAVEVKDLSFYRDPDTALYLADDGLAGTAVTATGDLVSVFKHPQASASREEMQSILRDASEISTTLDAFDINGFLPNLYAQFGFKPIARVPFNRDYAPKNWPYDLAGEPDVVLMVRDPNNVLPPAPEKYAEARDKYPVFEDYDEAAALQRAAKAQVVDSGLDPYVRFEPPIKKDVAIIDESIPNQRKQHKPAAATKTRAEYSVNQVLFSKIWQKTNQTVDGVKTNDYHYQLDDDGNFKLDKKGKKKPKLSSTRLNSRRGFDMIVSKKPRKAPGAKNITQPEQFYDRLDRAKEFLAGDIGAFLDTTGYVEYMTRAGAYGDLLVPPSGLAPLLNNPKQYVDLVTGGYHEDLTAPGTIDAAMEGLDSTVEMRRVIGDTPPPMITAMHHLWGILSRMLPPVHQEAGWLRLVSNRPVLEAIQSSIDGNYNISKDGWKSIVNRAFKGTASGTGGFGNNSKANANAFHSMLQNLNGKWDQMSDAYHVDKDSTEMGRAFWKLVNENGSMGIKNKVQRFIGLTFGTPGVIMDRWKYVEYNLPMLMNRLQRNGYPANSPKEYFDYGLSGTTPEDPNGIYGTYGAIESGSSSFSLAYYEGIEALINYAIQNSTDLQQLLGRHANVGGMHWIGWNAIKNEAVGHSSLGLTKDIAELVDHKSINPDSVLSIINSGTYFTEGLNGKTRNKVTLDRGEFSHE